MNLRRQFFTENECYKIGDKHIPKGIMLHSTGANNPYLKRYVAPDDGILGENKYGNHMNRFRPDGRQVCPHAFIGKAQNGNICTYQTLPWDMVGWHSGSGSKGNANFMGYIGFEMCEDSLADGGYFSKVYNEASELCAYLCREYNLGVEAITCHSEAHANGIASNHGDVMHWFPRYGKDMDTFRNDVQKLIDKQAEDKKEEDTLVDKKQDKLGRKLDNTPDSYAKQSVTKAVEKGVLKGNEIGNLMLHDNITRQDMLVILDRLNLL